MTDGILEKLSSIDPAFLAKLARQDTGAEAFELSDWSVTPVSHEAVVETTGGLYCFRGQGWDGYVSKPWSVILKIVNRPEDGCLDPQELCYWKRELLAYGTGMLATLPGGICSPRCYAVSEHEADNWIWMENIRETGDPAWSMAHFERAARRLGRFAGAWLGGIPLPAAPWLCGSLFRTFYADGEWWANFLNPESPNNAWQRPTVQTVFSEPLQSRVLQIWAEKWQLIEANERLPQVLCHNDAHRRNLMLRAAANGEEELVAIDWAFCGPGGLGNDLGELVGTSLSYFAVHPTDAAELEEAVLEGYLSGLRDTGWTGDERLARLGYTLSLALYWGGTLASEVARVQPENVEAKYGRPLEAVLKGWSALAEFALDRADESRYWMARLV
jgi:hypothetical protein